MNILIKVYLNKENSENDIHKVVCESQRLKIHFNGAIILKFKRKF